MLGWAVAQGAAKKEIQSQRIIQSPFNTLNPQQTVNSAVVDFIHSIHSLESFIQL